MSTAHVHTSKSALPEKAGEGTPTALLGDKSMRQSTLTDHSSGATCPTCGEIFSENGVAAHHWQAHGEELKETVECDYCGAELDRKPSNVYDTNFCDETHMYAYQQGENHHNYDTITTECVECGTTDGQLHDHHVDYEEDKTVALCASCHRKVHADESHELYPNQEYESDTANVMIDDSTRDELRRYKAEYGETYSDAIDRLLRSEGWLNDE